MERVRYANISQDLACLYNGTEYIKKELTLDEMIEIAVTRNLDMMVKAQEASIQQEIACQTRLKMMPALLMNYENYGRDRNTAAFSESLIPGVPPAPLSISQQTHVERLNVDLTWNLLDFSLAFFRSRQETNKYGMQQMEYCRVKQSIILNVTREYWKAVIAKLALKRAEKTIKETALLKERISKQVKARYLSSVRGYLTENDLVNVQVGIKGIERDYVEAKSGLSILMAIPPMIDFDVAIPDMDTVPDIEFDVRQLEEAALTMRPELYKSDFEEKGYADEIRAQIAQLFPGISIFAGPYYDANRFLLHNDWRSVGVRATWDLLRFPQTLRGAKVAQKQKCLARLNRIAMSMAVMAQVNMSYLMYREYLEQYKVAKELDDIDKKLIEASYKELKWGKIDAADVSEYEIKALLAEIGRIKAFGELQSSLEQLANAMGMPRYFTQFKSCPSHEELKNYYDPQEEEASEYYAPEDEEKELDENEEETP